MSEDRKDWAYAAQQWPALERVTPLVDPARLEAAAALLFEGDGAWVTELLNEAGGAAIGIEICLVGAEDARKRIDQLFALLGGALAQIAAREAIGTQFCIHHEVARIDAPSRH